MIDKKELDEERSEPMEHLPSGTKTTPAATRARAPLGLRALGSAVRLTRSARGTAAEGGRGRS